MAVVTVSELVAMKTEVWEKDEIVKLIGHLGPIITTDKVNQQHWTGHSFRVSAQTAVIAWAMGRPDPHKFALAAFLHDDGKLNPRVAELFGADVTRIFTAEERELANLHGYLGAKRAVEELGLASYNPDLLWLIVAAQITHHVKYKGELLNDLCHDLLFRGKEKEVLYGKQIPLIGRIVAVVDTFDALTGDRGYKRTWSRHQAMCYLWLWAGTDYDPDVVKEFTFQILGKKKPYSWQIVTSRCVSAILDTCYLMRRKLKRSG